MKKIINGKIIIGQDVLSDMEIIFDNKIQGITKSSDAFIADQIIDANGAYISAGFIDIHMHGLKGADIMDASVDGLRQISKNLPEYGVSSYLGTTVTASFDKIRLVQEKMNEFINQNDEGARLLGMHLEGPFINSAYKGAHKEEHIRNPKWEDTLLDWSVTKLVTISPETDENFELIRQLKLRNIKVSMGHTSMSYEKAKEAISAGVDSVTHLFNAMPSIHHRAPGCIVAALDSAIYTELIPDGVHVHPAVMTLVGRLKGADKLIIVTDSMMAAGLDDGMYKLGDLEVCVHNSVARLNDGTIAGSTLCMTQAMRNIMKLGIFSISEVVGMVTENPAKLLNHKHIGRLEIGRLADITIFDHNFNVHKTYVNGKLQYERLENYESNCCKFI